MKRTTWVVMFGVAAFSLAQHAFAAKNWPQFRGPNRDGFSSETGLLKKWPENGPPKVWTVTGAGQGYSTVAVAGGLIFGTGKKDGQEQVWALDEATGELTLIGHTTENIQFPRGFAIDPTGTWLYAMNQKGDTIVQLAIDQETGELTPTGVITEAPVPVSMVFKQ